MLRVGKYNNLSLALVSLPFVSGAEALIGQTLKRFGRGWDESATSGSRPWAFSHAGCFAFSALFVSFHNAPGLFGYPGRPAAWLTAGGAFAQQTGSRRGKASGAWSRFLARGCVFWILTVPLRADTRLMGVSQQRLWSAQTPAGRARRCFFFFLFCHGERGRREGRWGRNNKRDRAREWMCWNVTHVPNIRDSSHHPKTGAQLDRRWHQNSDMQPRN